MAILNSAPDGANVHDLGAARAARSEARAAQGTSSAFLKLDAGYVQIKAEFPLTVAFDFQAENIKAGLAGLLTDPADVDLLLEDGLTASDLTEITQFIAGFSLGES